MKKLRLFIGGFFVGAINALFGSGGGIIAVPILTKSGLSQKQAQATAVSVILPLTIITTIIYFCNGNLNPSKALPYIIPGIFGAIIGSTILKKLPDKILKKIFAVFMIFLGMRLIIK